MSEKQKLIDICFEIALTMTPEMVAARNEAKAEWVARQLRLCGFPTVPVGMSWGVLCNDDRPAGGIEA